MIVRFLPLALLAGCAAATPIAGRGVCRAEKAQSLVERSADEALFARALRLSGARSLRRIAPGDAVTMDFRTDRLNVVYDARRVVTRITCG